jgi:hypothetical protein
MENTIQRPSTIQLHQKVQTLIDDAKTFERGTNPQPQEALKKYTEAYKRCFRSCQTC